MLRAIENGPARIAAALFGAAALVTVLGVVLPHQPEVDEDGLTAVAAGSALLALALLVGRPSGSGLHTAAGCGTVLVSLAILFNGERHGGAPGGDEAYYLWVTLYAAYHFGRAATAAHVAFIAAAYAATLIAIDPGPVGVSRWLSTIGLAVGAAVVVRVLTERVDRLLRDLRRAAATDPLTGLLNRRAFEARMGDELARARRTGEGFALVLADVDGFKAVNDGHGHAAGDAALTALARTLAGALREVDTVARIGGDEFAILLPATDGDDAREAAARVVTSIRADSSLPAVSTGSAAYGPDGRTIDDLMRAADAALYAAKRGSRGAAA